MLNYFIYK